VASDGTFRLTVQRDGFYDVVATGVGPRKLERFIWTGRSDTVDVRGSLIYRRMLQEGVFANDTSAWRRYYHKLMREAPDAGRAVFARKEYDPTPIEAGQAVPDFSIPALQGDSTITETDLRGKLVLIDFWATWCAPCIEELPNIRRLHDRYADDGFRTCLADCLRPATSWISCKMASAFAR
jgi:thiol-disulfide isomerase/thioredoxin